MKNNQHQLTKVPPMNAQMDMYVLEAGAVRFLVQRDWMVANNPQVGGIVTSNGPGDPAYSPPVPLLPTKVTKDALVARIKRADYVVMPDGRTTICQLTMINGFTVRGESSCVSAENYNKVLGENYAYEKALDTAWGFEAYLLAERRFERSEV